MRRWLLTALIVGTGVAAAPSQADDQLPSLQAPAKILQAATVTVRVWNPETDVTATVNDVEPDDPLGPRTPDEPTAPQRVTVCSGVAVGKHLVVTPIYAASDSQIRITLPGGDQATGRVRVIDEYSGLTLVETDGMPLPPMPMSDAEPQVGEWVIGAAAWGAEAPLVLLGIVSGTGRTLPGAAYPPLLQCDLRTTETSSGAGVVDRIGLLVGVVVAADQPGDRQSWTYAVPVRHVQRLLRSAEDATDGQSVVILKRLRPTVGMVLDTAAMDAVIVSRVQAGSPADKAGIRVGDQVLAADGIKIRSVYQAVRPVLNKQPGDKMEFLLHRDGKVWATDVVLGGGVELPSAPFANLSRYVRPKLDFEHVGGGVIASRGSSGTLQEVYAPPVVDSGERPESPQSKIRLLEKALDRYQHAIVYLQDRLQREQQERDELEALLQSMQAEIGRLKAEVVSGD